MKRLKNFLKKKKGPRDLDTIKQEYAELRAKAGDTQYQAYIYAENLKLMNKRLNELNNEAGERIELDRQAAEASTPKAPEPNPQTQAGV